MPDDPDDAPVYAILGATGGIGSDVSRRLANDGAQLVLGARSEDALDLLADETGGETHPLDATDFEQVQQFVEHVTDTYGRLDGLVNCVGSILLKPAHLTSVEDFKKTLRLNLHTAFFAVKAAARPMMKSDGGGSIVLSASAVARKGLKNHEAIAAAKAGVIGVMRAAAATYAGRDVRVNAVAPGLVETPQSKDLLSSKEGRKQSEAMHPLGRLGRPADVARAICWLLDKEETGWVTGQIIGIDGGLGTLSA
jgi:NAD(P)-dependent dehydrogenase (short-subunit alcohol dehydrogenase family)